ncbi:HupE/UreJ family protein [Enterovibrio sp. ZSDZ42]|uniref:HupE/UreJ family protein n=1 Tax=Enterovibrio gelatinilyticus TaxID=2899819 RepID=A0ABT5QUD8_9GAMM|nr:HupE/UreJ family protein [Enterovibrio sp. ZSDZ42]MDD1791632.1 HupE/UreJ family protein [Enterovibrio sp. ZSDZ42]
MKRNGIRAATILTSAIPFAASAHTGHDTYGFLVGLSHPLTGADHMMAMLAVGMWAMSLNASGSKNATRAIPAMFIVVMAIGALAVMSGLVVPFVEVVSFIETGIAVSVLLLGMLLVGGTRLPLSVTLPATACFAVFHGIAHGAELPLSAHAVGYTLGFLFATTLLIAVGGALSAYARRHSNARIALPVSGGVFALAGLYQLMG